MRISEMRDNPHQMSLADRIRERLRATGQTANAASKAGGLNRDYIGDLLEAFDDEELPNPNPRLDSLINLAKGLECTLGDLLADDAPRSTREARILSYYRAVPDSEQPAVEAVVLALLKTSKSTSVVQRLQKARKKTR